MPASTVRLDQCRAVLAARGFAFVPGVSFRAVLENSGLLDDWASFAASWQRLEVDAHMADRGRYRRRRHAVYRVDAQGVVREPHQPHFQTLEYNPLHGGIERWFAPIEDTIDAGHSLRTILGATHALFAPLAPAVDDWRCEVHQFRIEATAAQAGLPTPEGVHRDGVDYVLVLMVRRHNIAAGTTTIHDADRVLCGAFTLAEPFDAALVDDHRCYHGVTAVTPIDPAAPAFRDVLVVTLARRA
jgi:hypothetical protein